MDFQPTHFYVPEKLAKSEVVLIAQAPPPKTSVAKAPSAAANVLTDVGAFKSITMPIGWVKNAHAPDKPYRALTTFDAPDKKGLHITVVSGNLPIEPAAHKVFLDMMSALSSTAESTIYRDGDAPTEGLRGMFTSLAGALGGHHVGDNQLVLSESPHPPSFHLSRALARKINGNNVLVVDGYYQDESSDPLEYTRVVFALCKDNFGHEMHHVAIASKNQADVNGALPLFDQTLNSITWSAAAQAPAK